MTHLQDNKKKNWNLTVKYKAFQQYIFLYFQNNYNAIKRNNKMKLRSPKVY